MIIKITIAGNDRTAIVLPVECAGLAAELMARATIYERDGYSSQSGWKRTEEGVQISYADGSDMEPTHPKVEAAEKEVAKHRSDWYAEYTKNQSLTKQLTELQAQIDGIRSVTTCQIDSPADAPEISETTEDDDLPDVF